jgi:type I restriction enzyme R subunit
MPTPEQEAREIIDKLLVQSGWEVQDRGNLDITANGGCVAVREFPLEVKAQFTGHADYLLYVNEKPAGVLEAKRADSSPYNAEIQAKDYTNGLAKNIDAPIRPPAGLPLLSSRVHSFQVLPLSMQKKS